jgi:hypothetical protein
MTEEAFTIAEIESAFAAVPRPANDEIAGCSCRECQEIRDDFANCESNQNIPRRMSYHAWDLGFLTPAARHYFLPVWMSFGIRQPHSAYADSVVEILQRKDGWDVCGGYTESQRRAILLFIGFVRSQSGSRYDAMVEAAWDQWIDSRFTVQNEQLS